MLKKAFFIAISGLAFIPFAAAADNEFGSNSLNVSIPDAGGWVSSTITINGAPADAVVTGIDVYFSCVHSYSEDLNIDLNADAQGNLGNHDLWSREGGSADNPSRTLFGIDTFNGLSVNRTWYLYARDEVAADSGYIDEWWIRVYYEQTAVSPTITSVSPDPVIGSNSPQPFTIFGSDFESGATVTLRDLSTGEVFPDRTISSQSTTHITINPNFTTAAATWSVEVINPGPASSGQFNFQVVAPTTTPTITSVSPDPVIGSNSPQPFTIFGSDFESGATVTLRDLSTGEVFPDRTISSQSTTHITINPNFTTAAATWSVEVINPGPASSGQFNFQVVAPTTTPTITSVSPDPVIGSNSPQPFTIFGSDFESGATVTLRDLSTGEVFPDRTISSQSTTHITINPNFTTAAATWSVEVINPGPASSGQFNFQVVAPTTTPTITSVSPDPVIGSNSPQPFTIFGSNFEFGATVTLRDLSTDEIFPDRTISSQSTTHITINPNFTTAAATWSVEVINPGPASSGQFNFQVAAPSLRTVFSPVNGPFRVTGTENPECFNDPSRWTFCQHQTDFHQPNGGIAGSDETYAWDINLINDLDAGEPVYPVEAGTVVRYAGLHEPGARSGAVLIEHSTNGQTWWSGYLHMEQIEVSLDEPVTLGTVLGHIGDASDAASVPNHLHLVIYEGTNTEGGLVSQDARFEEWVGQIFADGFESGDWSNWSSSRP